MDHRPIEPERTPTPAGEPRPLIPWAWLRATVFVVIFFVIQVVQGGAAFFILGITSDEDMIHRTDTPQMLLFWLFSVSVVLGIIWIFRRFVDYRSFVSLGFSFRGEGRMGWLLGGIWGVGIVSLVFLIVLALGSATVVGVHTPGVSLLYYFGVLLLAAFQEEIVTRGYLLNNLTGSYNKYISLVVVSVLFSAGHAGNPNVTWVGLANVVLAGLLLGIYYVHRQNLWFPVGLHFVWNFLLGPVYGSPVSGFRLNSVFELEFSGSELLSGGEFGLEASLVTTVVLILGTVALHLRYRQRDRRADRPTAAPTP